MKGGRSEIMTGMRWGVIVTSAVSVMLVLRAASTAAAYRELMAERIRLSLSCRGALHSGGEGYEDMRAT